MGRKNSFERDIRSIHGDDVFVETERDFYRPSGLKVDPLPNLPTWLKVLILAPLGLFLGAIMLFFSGLLILISYMIGSIFGGNFGGVSAAIFMGLVCVGLVVSPWLKRPS